MVVSYQFLMPMPAPNAPMPYQTKTGSWLYWMTHKSAPSRWFTVGAFIVIMAMALMPTQVTGDAHEYLEVAQAWFDHASPDVRAEDIARVQAILAPHHYFVRDPHIGFFQARNGRWYCWHFWLYSLYTLPFKAALYWLGADEFHAFKCGNLLLFLLACYAALFHSAVALAKRWMWLGLSAISPVIWYLNWTHTETFCWSFVVLSLVALSHRRYALAASGAAIAAMQNPPLLFLAFYMVVAAARERQWRAAFNSGACATGGLLPSLFYAMHFGYPNLIVHAGYSGLRFISWSRFWSFCFDLNQGLLPYMPGLLFLVAGAGVYAIRYRDRQAGILSILLIIIILTAAMTRDWISAMCGLIRYAVWMLPIFGWLIVETLPDTPTLRRGVALAVAMQGLILLSSDGRWDTLTVKWPARLVWNYAPAQYNPQYIIFAQRVTHSIDPQELPIGYLAPSGNVTKLLTDGANLSKLPRKFRHVDPHWLEEMQREYKGHKGAFYLQPPPGTVVGPALR